MALYMDILLVLTGQVNIQPILIVCGRFSQQRTDESSLLYLNFHCKRMAICYVELYSLYKKLVSDIILK